MIILKVWGFQVNVEVFTISESLDNMKIPNYFLKQELITENTMLDEFYYETTLNAKIICVFILIFKSINMKNKIII